MNIIDVAKEAGVSKTTVSRVLSNSKLVKPETKEKVQEVIDRLGFVPNTSAQKLAGNKNYVIGIINGSTINDPFYGYVEERIALECRNRGYGVIYTVARDKMVGCDREISMFYGKIDAYIILSDECVQEKDVEKVVHMRMPIALFKSKIVKNGALSVNVDNEQGGYMAAKYLLEKGHKKIGYMHGRRLENFDEGNERAAGFMRAMQDYGKDIAVHFYGNRKFVDSYHLTEEVLSSNVDAVFCETDLMAYGLLQGLAEKGVAIPERLAVLGFDNIKFSNYETQFSLSTIGQPLEEMVAYVVESLINKIENDQPYNKLKLFETNIVAGKTV